MNEGLKVARLFHFLGKGGVGKTTSAALQSVLLSKKGKTLLVSLDPAHNLGDVLNAKLKDEPTKISENLYAMEPDINKLMSEYSKKIAKEIESHYKYLKVLNLDKLVRTIEYTPGVEEQVLLEEITRLMELDYDYVVIDHAPTALSVRVLLLPQILLNWLSQIRELRLQILKRRKVLGNEEIEDKVLEILNGEINKYERVEKVFKSKNLSPITIVLNPEEMPCLEAVRIKEVLRKFDMPLCGVVVNKVIFQESSDPTLSTMKEIQRKWIEFIEREFGGYQIVKVPYIAPPPRGVKVLEEIADKYLGEPLCYSG